MNLLPDIATAPHSSPSLTLNWVGMNNVDQTIKIQDGDQIRRVNTLAQVYVNLTKEDSKGIHMSRLYLQMDAFFTANVLTPNRLKLLLQSFIASHKDLSSDAFLQLDFDCLFRRKSLKSDNSGLHSYPVIIKASLENGQLQIEMGIKLLYSSTCPCSAALARDLIQTQFDQDFSNNQQISHEQIRTWLGSHQGIMATPHSQRSEAHVLVTMQLTQQHFPISQLVRHLESVLNTPVQAAVKREDEQEFARLNGQNPMFCEDSARYLKQALDADPRFLDYWLKVEHMESLHPHNAVAIATKNILGGYTATP